MSDGTLLNPGTGGDTIATEDILTADQRDGDQSLPSTEYKIPRSKIAIGTAGQDLGDVGPDAPIDVRGRRELLVLETILVELQAIRRLIEESVR